MADNTLEIGFSVGTGELNADLDQVVQAFNATCAEVSQDLNSLSYASRKVFDQNNYAALTSYFQELRTLGQISADESIKDLKNVENQRYAAILADMQSQTDAADQKLTAEQKYYNRLDQLHLQHDAKMRQLDQKAIAETMQAWESTLAPISSAFSSSLSGMITRQESFRQALANIGNAIVNDFVSMTVKRATHWLASELTMTASTEAGDAARLASQNAAAAEGKAVSAAAGSVSVFGDANKAAAGAFSAVAGIPYIGPILAPAAAVAAFAAVMAFDVFSAEGGFDIPAGLNPVTQLHQREMVLPASIAEPLRAGLSGGGGSGGTRQGGGDIHIHAVDAASFQRLLANNKSALAKALRGAHRTFDPALA